MKESSSLMYCKIHCPFICFCKRTAAAAAHHLYNTSSNTTTTSGGGPLKLENTTPNPAVVVPSPKATNFDVFDEPCSGVKKEEEDGVIVVNGKEEEEAENNVVKTRRSCIRKIPVISDENKNNSSKEEEDEVEVVGKKRVQWIDMFGKDLAEIKEFEPSETGDTDNEEESSSRCLLCVIL